MSYRINIEPYTNNSSFVRSLMPIIDEARNKGYGLTTMYELWEETYGGVLVYGNRAVVGIDFPSESDATLFVLRWA